jgi:hypothetical protein
MVTNAKEGTRIKGQQYWPESGKKNFGPFQVTITDQQIFADQRRLRAVPFGGGGGKVSQMDTHKLNYYYDIIVVAFHFGGAIAPPAPPVPPPLQTTQSELSLSR